MARARLTWDRGPAKSRLVRTLSYVAWGLFGGLLLSGVVLFRRWLASIATDVVTGDVGPVALAFAVFVLVFLVPMLWVGHVHNRRIEPRSRAMAEWQTFRPWRWGTVAAVVVAVLILLGEVAFEPWFSAQPRTFSFAVLLAAVAVDVLAHLLGPVGELDPGTMTLSYKNRDDADLRYLDDAKRLRVGGYTFLWLSFVPGAPDRFSVQGLYVLPTEVVERAWPVFEAGIAADVERGEKSTVAYRVNVLVTAVAVALPIAGVAWLVWVGASLGMVLQWVFSIGLVVFLFVQFFARTM